MRIRNRNKRFTVTARLQLFAQLIFIVFLIIIGVLISSSSFYIGMIESISCVQMRNSLEEVMKLNFDDPEDLEKINNIECDSKTNLEVYRKNNPNSSGYTKPIYRKSALNTFYNDNGTEVIRESTMVDFVNADFFPIKTYSDGSQVGIVDNDEHTYKYFSMVMTNQEGNRLYVSSIKYNEIEAQANSVSVACSILCIVIFVFIAIAVYLFIRKILDPIKVIIDTTQEMTTTQKINLQIPNRNRVFIDEIDQAINNVNILYQSLMITQSELSKKTDFLLQQVKEKDAEMKAREEFIGNTSHELKTPIAIIQGYAEGIQFVGDDPIAMDEYCETIIDECQRMKDLIVGMMSLSDINRNVDEMKYVNFSITDFIAEKLQLLDMIFSKKKITIDNRITYEIQGYADVFKMSYVINNLLSNAISYIENEKVIRLRYEDTGLAYRIFVYNSGKNLDKETLDKLWESFYRTDASRNRTDGHFGLGLSIVKAVQDAHSQQCGVDNADGGVEFWFDISKPLSDIQ